MYTRLESVLVVYKGKKIVGVVHRDGPTSHNVIHKCEEMDMEEIASLIGKEEKTS